MEIKVLSIDELLMFEEETESFLLEESSLCTLCSYTCHGGTKVQTAPVK